MPTDLENLQTTKSNIVTILAELTDPLKRKPTYTVEGQTFHWTAYQKMLMDQLKQVKLLIREEEDGPFEIRTEMLP